MGKYGSDEGYKQEAEDVEPGSDGAPGFNGYEVRAKQQAVGHDGVNATEDNAPKHLAPRCR